MKKFHHIALATLLATVASLTHAGPIGYSAWDVGGNDKLVRFDLSTGVGTVIGSNLGFTDVDGLAFNASSELFGVDDSTNNLLKIDTSTGQATAVGSLESPGSTSFNDMGLAFIGNTLYMSSTTFDGVGGLFTVNTSTGVASLLGNFGSGVRVRSLGSHGGVLYGWSNTDTLLKLNTSTAATTTVGPFLLSSPTIGQDGMDIDPATGTIWGISEVEKRTYTLDASTGKATIYATSLTCGGAPCTAFNSLAIAAVPEPEGYSLALAGLGVLGLMLRRRST